MTPETATLIVCMGNELACDDGVGMRIGRALRTLHLPRRISLELRAQVGLDLLDWMDGIGRVVIVDAVTFGRAPGTCVVLDNNDLIAQAQQPCHGHLVGIPETLMLASKALGREAPAVWLVGIEAKTIDQFGIALSQPVAAAIPQAIDSVLRLADAPEELLQAGAEAARLWMGWRPTIEDILASSGDPSTPPPPISESAPGT